MTTQALRDLFKFAFTLHATTSGTRDHYHLFIYSTCHLIDDGR